MKKKFLAFLFITTIFTLKSQDYRPYLIVSVYSSDSTNDGVYKYLRTTKTEFLKKLEGAAQVSTNPRVPQKFTSIKCFDNLEQRAQNEISISKLMMISKVKKAEDSLYGLPFWYGEITNLRLVKEEQVNYNRKIELYFEYKLYNLRRDFTQTQGEVHVTLDSMSTIDFVDGLSDKIMAPILEGLPKKIEIDEREFKIQKEPVWKKRFLAFHALGKKHYPYLSLQTFYALSFSGSSKSNLGYYFGKQMYSKGIKLMYATPMGISIGTEAAVFNIVKNGDHPYVLRNNINNQNESMSSGYYMAQFGLNFFITRKVEVGLELGFGKIQFKTLTEFSDIHVKGKYTSSNLQSFSSSLKAYPFATSAFGVQLQFRFLNSSMNLEKLEVNGPDIDLNTLHAAKEKIPLKSLQFLIGITTKYSFIN